MNEYDVEAELAAVMAAVWTTPDSVAAAYIQKRSAEEIVEAVQRAKRALLASWERLLVAVLEVERHPEPVSLRYVRRDDISALLAAVRARMEAE